MRARVDLLPQCFACFLGLDLLLIPLDNPFKHALQAIENADFSRSPFYPIDRYEGFDYRAEKICIHAKGPDVARKEL